LVALVYPANVASVKVLEKIGMRRIGEKAAHGTSLLLYEATREDLDHPAGGGPFDPVVGT
jgi:RimJ/RimL family protein N-acetyltransferase